jgi:hypothetical protein
VGDLEKVGDALNKWIFARGAAVRGFFATPAFMSDHERRSEYLRKNGEGIHWVDYKPQDSTDEENSVRSAIDVSLYCPKLMRFFDDRHHHDAVLTAISNGCLFLEDVRLSCGVYSSESVTVLAGRCTRLKHGELKSSPRADPQQCWPAEPCRGRASNRSATRGAEPELPSSVGTRYFSA